MIPVPLYVVLVLWIDRYEGEPFWMLGDCVLLGCAGGYVLRVSREYDYQVCIVSLIAGNANAGEAFAAVISAPIVEEIRQSVHPFHLLFLEERRI